MRYLEGPARSWHLSGPGSRVGKPPPLGPCSRGWPRRPRGSVGSGRGVRVSARLGWRDRGRLDRRRRHLHRFGRTRADLGLRRGHPLGRRRRSALRRAIAVRGRRLVDADDEVTDVDLVRVLDDERARDLAPVDVGPVRALQIDDDELLIFEDDASVPLRHVPLGEDDVVPLHPPDGDLRLVEHHAALLAAFFLDDDGEHWLLREAASRSTAAPSERY